MVEGEEVVVQGSRGSGAVVDLEDPFGQWLMKSSTTQLLGNSESHILNPLPRPAFQWSSGPLGWPSGTPGSWLVF